VKNTLTRLLAGAKRNHWPQQHVDALQALIDGKRPRLKVTAEEAEAIARSSASRSSWPPAAAARRAASTADPDSVTTGGHNGATPHFAEPILLHKHDSDGGRSYRAAWASRCRRSRPNGAARSRGRSSRRTTAAAAASPARASTSPLPRRARRTLRDRHADVIRAGRDDANRTGACWTSFAVTGSNEIGIATPFLVPNFGERPGQEPRTHDVRKSRCRRSRRRAHPARAAVIAPCTHHDASARARGDDQPLPTITGANRGELAIARPFVSLCTHGNEANAAAR
jgi:DNA (cytosine-5)-methyltransferase 1